MLQKAANIEWERKEVMPARHSMHMEMVGNEQSPTQMSLQLEYSLSSSSSKFQIASSTLAAQNHSNLKALKARLELRDIMAARRYPSDPRGFCTPGRILLESLQNVNDDLASRKN